MARRDERGALVPTAFCSRFARQSHGRALAHLTWLTSSSVG